MYACVDNMSNEGSFTLCVFSDCDCDLFLLIMGYIVQPSCCDKKNHSRNQKKIAQCERALRDKINFVI